MMKRFHILTVTVFVIFFTLESGFTCGQEKSLSGYVDPLIGTDFFGHTFPGPCVPFGMIHPSPDTGTEGWTHCAGYVYSEPTIIGFSHTHWSGVGMVDGGDILIMPVISRKLLLTPGSEENPEKGYRSRFDHENEIAQAGYYSVVLKDYGIRAELTTTKRVAFHQYTFPESKDAKIVMDLGHTIGTLSESDISELTFVNDHRIEGEKLSGNDRVYFVAEFSKPFLYYGTFDADYQTPESGTGYFAYKSCERGRKIGAFVTYHTNEGEQIRVKVAISYTGIEGATKNLDAELPHWDFEKTKNQAKEDWDKALSVIKIRDKDETRKQIFYTSIYHSLVAQYINQDVDGKYSGYQGKIHYANGFDFYGSFSCWDTYRTQHPLLTLIAPGHVNDFIKSIVEKTRDYGWLPGQHFMNNFGEGMVGDHLVPVIVDAYLKGFSDYDIDFIYNAMRTKSQELPKPPLGVKNGRSGLEFYKSLGYIPADRITESVPKTMEFAYDDWCIGQMAKKLGREDDYRLLMKSARNYANVWDVKTRFMRPRMADGSWLEAINGRPQEIITENGHSYYKYFDPLLVGRRPNRHYTESNAWQYIWSVQHDIPGLIELFGGKKNFVAKLDTFFTMSSLISLPKYVGVVGTIGQYVHGNQPSHHVAYLYNYAGQPWKTQLRVRQIMDDFYRTGPGGLCGNEDMGSLSSWYVLSALGIYPVAPCSGEYAIGSPVFEVAEISLPGNKTFTIRTINNSGSNKYIQSATFNGKPFRKNFIAHDEIIKGGELVFEMGDKENRKWTE